METAQLANLPIGLVERATRVHVKSFVARRKFYSSKQQHLNHKAIDNLFNWFLIIEKRYGRAYASRLHQISRARALTVLHPA